MASTSRSSSRRRLTMVSLGARLYLLSLLSLLLFGGMIITPVVSSPTALPPADHESILHALRFQGQTATADALDNVIWNHGFLVPASATIFVPMNAAMASVAASLNVTELIELLSYHIVTENLPVRRLTNLPVGTKLKTMVGNSTLVVTENTKTVMMENTKTVMTINHREVMPKDLCTISTVACYAVTEVLMLESGAGEKKSFGVSFAALGEAPTLPPSGLPLPPLGAPVVPLVSSPLGAPVPAGAPTVFPPSPTVLPPSPTVLPPSPTVLPPSPTVLPPSPTVLPPSPTVLPPSPTVLPPSPIVLPGTVPVPTGAPAVIILPSPGSPGGPGGAPLSPGEAPEGAASAAMATTASMATLVAAVMLTILVL